MDESTLTALLGGIAVGVMIAYLFLRLGPRRCPSCGRWCFGVWGLARQYLKCKRCGREFEGQTRPH